LCVAWAPPRPETGASRPGTLVYDSWLTMQSLGEADPETCAFNDLALVRIDPADVGRGGARTTLPGGGAPASPPDGASSKGGPRRGKRPGATRTQPATPGWDDRRGMVRVLVVDDHPVLRGGLEAVLRAEPGFVCVGVVADGSAMHKALHRTAPIDAVG
jgi:hypothetical protein